MDETVARQMWDSWSTDDKKDFLEFHDYNPNYAQYAWPLLPYSIQQDIRKIDDPSHDETIPHIIGSCGNCSWPYDLKGGISCPKCGFEGIGWAFHAQTDDEMAEVIKNLKDKLTPTETIDAGNQWPNRPEDIQELEKLL